MPNQNFDINIINKMRDHLDAMEKLYCDLSDDSKNRFFEEFYPRNHPEKALFHLDAILNVCLDIVKER